MTPERWLQVERIYHEAEARPPGERASFLDQACAGDAGLRGEVERMLAGDSEAAGFLEAPAVEMAARALAAGAVRIPPGSRLGPYEIVSLAGAGGMGEVYQARDTRLNRTVAIKVLPPVAADDAERRRRFLREARAASALNHPNIVTIYDVVSEDGRDSIVMEYVEGQTLKGPLPVEEALRLAVQIASALVAAHEKGILHRDLKPGNILVSKSGVKLLDFGLAKLVPTGPRPAEATVTAPLTATGQILGTLAYMSPEQLQGKEADARSEIFAFGAVLYEMLTGRSAFQRPSAIETIAAVGSEDPKPLHELVRDVPDDLERIIRRCLRKHPEERYASMLEIERELEDCRALTSQPASGINLRVLFRQSKRPIVAIPVLIIVLALGIFFAWGLWRVSRARWARDQALPEIARLVEREESGKAYALATQADRYIPDDPVLRKLWPEISLSASIHTTPPGAFVFRRNYDAPNAAWELVGRSPIEKRRIPLVDSQWRFELKGFATVERATFPFPSSGALMVTMDEEAKAPAEMVRVGAPASASGQSTPVTLNGLAGFEDLPAVPLGDYWIDRYEVTNAQFRQFLDQGGYRKQEYWKQEFRKDGHTLSWAEAVAVFRDTTGRPGPATWVQGEYPRGQEDFPVTGVSWYEAAAYAEFAGKSLPTIYHWTHAASLSASASIMPASSFGGQGPARVGTHRGMSGFGAYDMAGNVKEWCWNEANAGKRYILGGAWDEPSYMFNNADARAPLERSANFGFRCARYVSTGGAAKAGDPVTREARDFSRENPVSDQLYRAYKSLYSYDKTPLDAVVESTEQTGDWKREKITFASAYGNERVIAYLFLPIKAAPPYQTVLYFPGSGALRLRSLAPFLESFDFVIKSGRAVMFPVYKGTFERREDLKPGYAPDTPRQPNLRFPNTTSSYRDHVIAWSKDLGRSIDYLETRPDIDRSKLAYEGYSWGAAVAPVMVAVEDRIKVCLLILPGFWRQKCMPEVDQLNFAPRVKVPILMLHGRYDYVFPGETSEEPMFRLLGTPKEQKRRVVYETGHNIPRNEMIKESLNWLDRYLGPVK
jgi:serine/threonine protein kinase/formylglycine-generating enzyme required for sulfatase activity/cephalosporin-C deacetylase-like acetyl esterase